MDECVCVELLGLQLVDTRQTKAPLPHKMIPNFIIICMVINHRMTITLFTQRIDKEYTRTRQPVADKNGNNYVLRFHSLVFS